MSSPHPEPRAEPAETVEWLELFFDLVVVVCLAILAERLHEHADIGGLAVFLVVFTAIWSTWTSFVIYADIANETTRVAVLMAAAGLIGLMTTTLPDLDERSGVFAIAFVVCRVMAARASLHTGRLLTSWPGVQLGGPSALWIASIWVDAPATYWLWAVALALELVLGVARASDDPEAGAAMAAQVNARQRRRERPGGRVVPPVVPIRIRGDHLGERLGLFVIIVLGEGVTQVIQSGSEAEWSRQVRFAEGAAFLLIVGLWWLIFHHRLGIGGGSHGIRVVLPVHLLATASLVLLATALGDLLQSAVAEPDDFWRWTACGAIAAWFAVVSAVAVAESATRAWILTRPLVSAIAALAVGALGAGLDGRWLVMLLLAAVAWTALAPAPTEGAPA